MSLTRSGILDSIDLPRHLVSVPEWNGDVYVRGLTAGQRDRLESVFTTGGDRTNVRALIAVMCTVDQDGNRLFTDVDIELLADKNAKALDRIFEAVMKVSGLSDGDVKAMEGN